MASTNWAALAAKAADAPDNYTPLAPDKYQVECESAEAKTTKTGKTMFALTLKVVEGQNAGRKLWTNIVISPENAVALSIAFRHFAALGADTPFFATDPDDATVCAKLIGGRATATVVLRKDDLSKNEVKDLSASAGGDPLAATPAQSAPAPSTPPADPF